MASRGCGQVLDPGFRGIHPDYMACPPEWGATAGASVVPEVEALALQAREAAQQAVAYAAFRAWVCPASCAVAALPGLAEAGVAQVKAVEPRHHVMPILDSLSS